MAETPLEMYKRLRPKMTPIIELTESVGCYYTAEDGNKYLIHYAVSEDPKKPGSFQDKGTLLISGQGLNYQCNMMVDQILDAHYEGNRLEVVGFTWKVIANKIVRDSNGDPKPHFFQLSIGTNGVRVSGELDLGLCVWDGSGYNYLEIPSGKKVQMVSSADTATPTE